MRKIPATMATQHPDNAGVNPCTGGAYVSNADEIAECYHAYAALGVQEYMWDWEGKFVDEAVIDRLYQQYTDFFQQNSIGKDLFLTYRIPNIWEESSHRLPRAFMNLISAEQVATRYGFHSPPLNEVILPMTTSAQQLITLRHRYAETAQAAEGIFQHDTQLKDIAIIPLFEEISVIHNSANMVREYLDDLPEAPDDMRVFLARSDPAMNAGLIPTMVSLKVALSDYAALEAERGIPIHSWVGGGSLPFRGGISPDRVHATMDEYAGVSTLTIQSAFRCDYPLADVKSAIRTLNTELQPRRSRVRTLTPDERTKLIDFANAASGIFRSIVEQIAHIVNEISSHVPSHRERVQHIGIFGYARGIGETKLPRAIKFTASLYSLGVPPELLGAGRVLQMAQQMGILPLVRDVYVNLVRDMEFAGAHINRENLAHLASKHMVWKEVQEDIALMEKILGIDFAPKTTDHILHRNTTSNIFHRWRDGQPLKEDILAAAKLRKSLG